MESDIRPSAAVVVHGARRRKAARPVRCPQTLQESSSDAAALALASTSAGVELCTGLLRAARESGGPGVSSAARAYLLEVGHGSRSGCKRASGPSPAAGGISLIPRTADGAAGNAGNTGNASNASVSASGRKRHVPAWVSDSAFVTNLAADSADNGNSLGGDDNNNGHRPSSQVRHDVKVEMQVNEVH